MSQKMPSRAVFSLLVAAAFFMSHRASAQGPLPLCRADDSRAVQSAEEFHPVDQTRVELAGLVFPLSGSIDLLAAETAARLRASIKIQFLVKSTETGTGFWRDFSQKNAEAALDRVCFALVKDLSDWPPPSLLHVNPETLVLQPGDIMIDDRFAYVRNGLVGKASSDERTVQSIQEASGKKVLMLPDPGGSVDHFHMPVGKSAMGKQTSLVADPMKLLDILSFLSLDEVEQAVKRMRKLSCINRGAEKGITEDDFDRHSRLAERLDRSEISDFLKNARKIRERMSRSVYVASLERAVKELKNQGVSVVRVPALPIDFSEERWHWNEEGNLDLAIENVSFPLGFYYVSVIQDTHRHKRTAVIPEYGIEKLDRYVLNVYKSLKSFEKIYQVPAVVEGANAQGLFSRVHRKATQRP